jgi:hypothetical protein
MALALALLHPALVLALRVKSLALTLTLLHPALALALLHPALALMLLALLTSLIPDQVTVIKRPLKLTRKRQKTKRCTRHVLNMEA